MSVHVNVRRNAGYDRAADQDSAERENRGRTTDSGINY